jgi:DNA-binding MarR family transcriptional regulator
LRVVHTSGGISQQSLAQHLRILPSRLVVLIDELEERGMIERRADPADRRSYALHLTNTGRDTMKAIGRVARDHQDALLASLSTQERDLLSSLLLRVANQQGLRPGVHPGFARLRAQRRPTKPPVATESERKRGQNAGRQAADAGANNDVTVDEVRLSGSAARERRSGVRFWADTG